MGYIRHHGMAVTSWDEKEIRKAHDRANKVFKNMRSLVSEILESSINGYYSFFIAPDGSKEGWEESDNGDFYRNTFIKWINRRANEDGSNSISFCEFFYGDDNGESQIINHN